VFRFLRIAFEGWARATERPLSPGLNRRVAGLPRSPTESAESLSVTHAECGVLG